MSGAVMENLLGYPAGLLHSLKVLSEWVKTSYVGDMRGKRAAELIDRAIETQSREALEAVMDWIKTEAHVSEVEQPA